MRLLRHLFALPGAVARAFPAAAMASIESAIRASERLHDGEIRFAVEAALHPAQVWRGVSARERAIAVFSELGVWDTERNNGVLLYLLLAERDVEIVADCGFDGRIEKAEWQRVCTLIEREFAAGRWRDGVLHGIEAATVLVAREFPAEGPNRNEQQDRPAVL